MSRFTVGQEITPKETGEFFTYGKFYRVADIECGGAVVIADDRRLRVMMPDFSFTREEYEQAEREKDPFAPGKWVVCAKDDTPARVGDILKVTSTSHKCSTFTANIETDYIENDAFYKSHFRPATPEEVKEQEIKIMDEHIEIANAFQIDPDIFTTECRGGMAEPNRQTFTVGGQEFYISQIAWITDTYGPFLRNAEMSIVGVDRFDGSIVLRAKGSKSCISISQDRFTTTKPKPHEWKFRDWARDKNGRRVFVAINHDGEGRVVVIHDGCIDLLDASDLTYISTAEIPE